jgi:hypothetical protein
MSDGISIDASALDKLVADLGKVPDGAGKNLRKAVEVGARNVKEGWRGRLKGASHASGAAATVSYDMKGGEAIRGSEISAEIGPELKGQGPIAGLIEMGTPTLSPRGYGLAALQDEAPDLEKGVEIAIDQALKAAGL